MTPLRFQPHKYLFKEEPEKVFHSYYPSFGGDVIDNPDIIDPRILTALKSGVRFQKLNIVVTNKRIKLDLIMPSFGQELEICYQDLRAIHVTEAGWETKLVLQDSQGLTIWLNATRPHFVATELWVSIASMLGTYYRNLGQLKKAHSLITSIDASTIKVPDDFLSIKGEQYSSDCAEAGFCLPINQPPYWLISKNLLATQEVVKPVLTSIQINQLLRNSERLALQGDPQPDGSWKYTEPNGAVHTISAERVQLFMEQTHQHATIMCGMIDKLNEAGLMTEAVTSNTDQSVATGPQQLQSEKQPISNASNIVTSPTATAVSSSQINVSSGSVPVFQPSLAAIPATTLKMETAEAELKYAIHNSPIYFQSFFNDLEPLTSKGFDDDVISANCFDEDLYCALVREMHRYTLAEVSANQDQIAKSNAGLGAMVGSFLGLITGNIFAPFIGHTYGKNMTDRSRRIEEFLPDPKLLFNQDVNSYLSWSRGQVSSPRLRRLIIDRQIDANGRVYFRLLPAIVTADSVYPIQLFKLEPSSYFYRPLAAGIGDDAGRNQPNYDPIKIQRKYFHIRAEGEVNPTDISLKVYGRDIEDYSVKLYRYTGHSLDYFYADFKIQPGSVF